MKLRFVLLLIIVMLLLLPQPASSWPNSAKDIWPAMFWTTANGADNLYVVFWSQAGTAWRAPRLICADMLTAQWTPQRQGIGYRTSGRYGVALIENVSNDLEYYESTDNQWTDDLVGAWTLTDDDASQDWLAVDCESRQNYVWGATAFAGISPAFLYIDLSAGVPTWTPVATTVLAIDNIHYSIVLDEHIQGYLNMVLIATGTVRYAFPHPAPPNANVPYYDTTQIGDYPQILGHFGDSLFYTYDNALYFIPNLLYWALANVETVYTAATLTNDYHATWLARDDTVHCVVVDLDVANPNATTLNYIRRTPNGFDAPIVLLTVDSRMLGDHLEIHWPTITCDPFGAIFIFYILWDSIALTGDLQGFYLDSLNYSNPVVGSWVQHLDIDDSADVILGVVTLDNMPVCCDM